MSNAIDRLEELEGRATKGPMKAAEITPTSNPLLLGPDGQSAFGLLATFYWGCHPNTPEAEAKMVDGVESLVELLAALRNAAKPLLAVVRAGERINADLAANGDNIVTDDDKEALRLALATLKEMPL